MLSSVLIVDAILKIVNIVILLKLVQVAHGKNVVAGLIYMKIPKTIPIVISENISAFNSTNTTSIVKPIGTISIVRWLVDWIIDIALCSFGRLLLLKF